MGGGFHFFVEIELKMAKMPAFTNLKNSGRLWLAYTELHVGFNMLQLMSVDSGHFTQPELWL